MARKMARILSSLSLSVPLALAAGMVHAQTVGDYRAAMDAAPITDAAAPLSIAHCETLTNYVFTSIPDDRRSGLVLPLYTFDGSQSAETAAKREACLAVRTRAVIAFDSGTGQQIVTPAEAMEGPTDRGPYYKEPDPNAPAPHTGRATPRQPMPRGGMPAN